MIQTLPPEWGGLPSRCVSLSSVSGSAHTKIIVVVVVGVAVAGVVVVVAVVVICRWPQCARASSASEHC